jgi:hypothetical protein
MVVNTTYVGESYIGGFRVRHLNINLFRGRKKMKKEVFVRFANDSVYYTRIMIDPKKIENPLIFPNEVFFDIDGIRVAVKK